MRLSLLALACAAFFAPVAALAEAPATCYSAAQLEAEQGLRIHSELMIIALNCQHLSGGVQLNRAYEAFTRRNIDLIKGYERTMKNVFATEGRQNSEAALNTFRTSLANRIANEAVRLQPNVFCRAYSGRIAQANAMSQPQFRKWAQTVFPGYPLTHEVCAGVAVHTQAYAQ